MKLIVISCLLIGAAFAYPGGVAQNQFIVGGENAIEGEAPYMVTLQVDRQGNGNYRHTCGGSIISAEWILTAGHCITENSLEFDFQIIAGQLDFDNESGSEQLRAVSIIKIHPNYTGDVAPYDLALLKLAEPLDLIDGTVEAIKLPQPNFIHSGDATLFGWGSISTTEEAEIPSILQTVTKDIIPYDLCREVLYSKYPSGTPFHSTNLCTGPLNSQITACVGDSGGPLVQRDGNDLVEIVGVASWISAFPCGAINAVTVYVRVSAFNDWITETIAA